jgi:hypothetical protein
MVVWLDDLLNVGADRSAAAVDAFHPCFSTERRIRHQAK